MSFLQRLTLQLTIGASTFPESLRDRHGDYLLRLQRADGGWSGREGESDLYYTGFALRSLAILGLLEGAVAERAAGFLKSQLATHQGWVDLLSLVYGAQLIEAASNIDCMAEVPAHWESRLADLLQRLRRPDGGYSKSDEGQAGSTYQTFLVVVCMELLERPVPDPERVVQFLLSQHQAAGGFLEIRVGKRAGTNPTAAAITALSCLKSWIPNGEFERITPGTVDFFAELQSDDGGFQANSRMPVSDVLSTFTACTALWELESLDAIDLHRAGRYVASMQRSSGGFAGFELDPADDVEYTFYGLGTLALASLTGDGPSH